MTTLLPAQHLTAGFPRPVTDSQVVFRAALEAFAHPGRGVELATALSAPPGLAPASAAFLLAMVDFETPLWLQHRSEALAEYLRFHCGCPLVDEPGRCHFGLITDASAMPNLDAFDAGDMEYPDRSATLVIQVPRLLGGPRVRVSGPGIAGEAHIEPAGLAERFWDQWRCNHALFPRGVDVLFVCGGSFLALPRTSHAGQQVP